jgi:S1-C subfamily serine protease
VQIGSLSTDGQKGWLGVKMEASISARALAQASQRRRRAHHRGDGGWPRRPGSLRLGDIIISYNGRTVPSMEDLRQQVSATSPARS